MTCLAACFGCAVRRPGLCFIRALDVPNMLYMVLPLELTGILVVSTLVTIGVLLIAYALAGWYERRARRRREERSGRSS